MVMRIGGLASGINTDEIIQKLMSAERMPLDKMHQDRTLLEWQRDGYREIYQKLNDLDTNTIFEMKKPSTYNSKTVTSSLESAVTATASTSALEGSYSIEVSNLASSAIKVGTDKIGLDPNKALDEQGVATGKVYFKTFDVETNAMKQREVEIEAGDTLKDVLKKISDDKTNHVRAFYDEQSQKVIFETTRTGDYNQGGEEITFDSDFFNSTLKLQDAVEVGGTDATFNYNGVEFTSKTNEYTMGGVTFKFNNVTEPGVKVNLNVEANVDQAFDSIMKFVNQYNELVDMINKSQTEERYRDYKPLTEEQKEDMSEKQIELWEEKAKSGILRGDTMLTSGLFNLRETWYSNVENDGQYNVLTQIGISTGKDYLNGGKIEVDENKLKEALKENPDDVFKLFVNNESGDGKGLINRLEDSIGNMMKGIEERAGKSTSTLDNYTLGKRIKDLDTRISNFEDRLLSTENRYWRQFNAMEQAISRLNNQSAQLLSQFGG